MARFRRRIRRTSGRRSFFKRGRTKRIRKIYVSRGGIRL